MAKALYISLRVQVSLRNPFVYTHAPSRIQVLDQTRILSIWSCWLRHLPALDCAGLTLCTGVLLHGVYPIPSQESDRAPFVYAGPVSGSVLTARCCFEIEGIRSAGLVFNALGFSNLQFVSLLPRACSWRGTLLLCSISVYTLPSLSGTGLPGDKCFKCWFDGNQTKNSRNRH